jgi:cystathionine beta-lyase/cystathionine gamma-synthase
LRPFGLDFTWVDSTDLANVEGALRPSTRMIYVETPTNPMMEVTDLAGAARLAKERGLLFAVDNTFMSPFFQRPLELGADFVLHSTTKFLNGHSDSIGGVLVATRPEHGEWFAFVQKSEGAILSPFDAFLVLRGLKTLGVRMERHEQSGRALADLLARHPKVRRVLYPGLADHPGHAVQKRQASGFGALITFDLGSFEAAKRFLDRVEVMSLAESLGGVETLTSHPASMTHASVPPETRAELGIGDGLVRISVGLEDFSDLAADCERALAEV